MRGKKEVANNTQTYTCQKIEKINRHIHELHTLP